MGTRPSSGGSYHACSCGENFDTTDELVEHARDVHGVAVY